MDGSKQHPLMTAGLDLGDRDSYLCLIDTESGEIMEVRSALQYASAGRGSGLTSKTMEQGNRTEEEILAQQREP
jgi:hypothetical protein